MRRWNAPTAYLIYCFGTALLFATGFTVAGLYRIEWAGLGALELALVGTVLEATVTFCEVPTGVLADLYGRRASVIAGLFLIGTGLIVEGSLPTLAAILAGQVLWGLGYTLTSGADAAWIADEVGEDAARTLYVRGAQAAQAGTLLGIGASVLLGGVRLDVPLRVAGVAFWVLAGFLALVMPETGYRPARPAGESWWRGVTGTFRDGWGVVRSRPGLAMVLVIAIFYGLAAEGFDRLWQLHLLTRFQLNREAGLDPVYVFGALSAGAMLLSIGAAELVRRRARWADPAVTGRLLLFISALLVPSVAGFGLAGSLAAAVSFYWMTSLLRETYDPVHTAWVNEQIEPSTRATVLSMVEQFHSLGEIIGGPILGSVAAAMTVEAGIVGSSVALLPVVGLYAWLVWALRQPRVAGGGRAEAGAGRQA